MQATSLQEFQNSQFGTVRTVQVDNQPYFVGRDVAIALGYAKPENALSQHVDNEDTLKQGIPDRQGFIQKTTLINESGLYALVFGSKLPAAKQFKKWVTSEVLPAIRRTGSYGVGPAKVLQKYGVQGVVYDGRVLYPYADIVRALGGSARGGTTSRRNKYPQHFCKLYGRNFITQQYVEQLARYYKSRTSQLALDFELEPDRLVHLLTLAHRIKDERLRLELVQELTRGGVQ